MLGTDGAAQHGVLLVGVGHADGVACFGQREFEDGVCDAKTRNKCI